MGQTIKKCDFCGLENVPFGQNYKCQSYRSKTIPLPTDMIDEWAACNECERLVENGDWGGLAHRCARLIKTTFMSYEQKFAIIVKIHKEFNEHRI